MRKTVLPEPVLLHNFLQDPVVIRHVEVPPSSGRGSPAGRMPVDLPGHLAEILFRDDKTLSPGEP